MRVAIHQPHYWPWLGYLRKMREADVFVYLDNADYTKNGFINRNRIRIDGKEHWLTIPVLTKGKTGQTIKKTEVNCDKEWNIKHYHTLLYNYQKGMKSKHGEIVEFYEPEDNLLVDWCMRSVELLCQAFGIKTPIIFESRLGIDGVGTERLVNICKNLNADTYLSGPSGRDYLDDSKFGNIKIEYMDWKPPTCFSALHYYLIDETEALEA